MFPRNSWLLEKFPEVIIFGIKLEKMSDKLPERLGDACWLVFHNFDIDTFGKLLTMTLFLQSQEYNTQSKFAATMDFSLKNAATTTFTL